jgi:glycine/D-amino acid oxidase-like deaminating enzyme
VVSVAEDADGVTVELATGPAVRARHVVIATLGPIHDPMFLSTRCEPRRSYAISLPIDNPLTDTYISVDDEPRSIRPAHIGDQAAIVVGGAGHVVGEMGDRSAQARWDELEHYATETFGCGPATHRWAAHDLVPSDHVPFIGPVTSRAKRRWVASGFQKWGISTSFVAANLIAEGIAGRTGDEAELFDPRRLASTVTTRLLHDGVRAARHLVLDKLDDLVHRAPARPRCSHLGCVLAYDADEATWDCPCHGSRYDAKGQVIAGPAVTAVAPRR